MAKYLLILILMPLIALAESGETEARFNQMDYCTDCSQNSLSNFGGFRVLDVAHEGVSSRVETATIEDFERIGNSVGKLTCTKGGVSKSIGQANVIYSKSAILTTKHQVDLCKDGELGFSIYFAKTGRIHPIAIIDKDFIPLIPSDEEFGGRDEEKPVIFRINPVDHPSAKKFFNEYLKPRKIPAPDSEYSVTSLGEVEAITALSSGGGSVPRKHIGVILNKGVHNNFNVFYTLNTDDGESGALIGQGGRLALFINTGETAVNEDGDWNYRDRGIDLRDWASKALIDNFEPSEPNMIESPRVSHSETLSSL